MYTYSPTHHRYFISTPRPLPPLTHIHTHTYPLTVLFPYRYNSTYGWQTDKLGLIPRKGVSCHLSRAWQVDRDSDLLWLLSFVPFSSFWSCPLSLFSFFLFFSTPLPLPSPHTLLMYSPPSHIPFSYIPLCFDPYSRRISRQFECQLSRKFQALQCSGGTRLWNQ